jgi:hypothetical protein
MQRARYWLPLGIALTVACDSASAPTEMTSTDPQVNPPPPVVLKIPIEETIIVLEPTCAGEILELHIRQQVIAHLTEDAAGGLHVHSVINDKGTTALGLTSGTTYHQVGATTETQNSRGLAPLTITRFNALNLLSEGSAPNLLVQQLFHITVNANSVVTTFMDVSAIVCQ